MLGDLPARRAMPSVAFALDRDCVGVSLAVRGPWIAVYYCWEKARCVVELFFILVCRLIEVHVPCGHGGISYSIVCAASGGGRRGL